MIAEVLSTDYALHPSWRHSFTTTEEKFRLAYKIVLLLLDMNVNERYFIHTSDPDLTFPTFFLIEYQLYGRRDPRCRKRHVSFLSRRCSCPIRSWPRRWTTGGVTFGRHIKTEVYMSRLQARIRKNCFDQSVGHEPHMLFKGSKMQQSLAGKGTMKIPNRD